MATKKKVSKKPTTIDRVIPEPTRPQARKLPAYTPHIIVLLGIILLLALAVSRGFVISAIVNGKPIFRMQLSQSLMAKYGTQTLEGMISEQLIYDEAKKTGVVVSAKDIEEKEAEILQSFGGKVSLEEILKYQGMTKEDFDNQVKVQLLVFKLLGKDVTITDEEVASFIETNKDAFVATEEGAMKEEAKNALLEQKINEKIQPWFSGVKEKAKILRFHQ